VNYCLLVGFNRCVSIIVDYNKSINNWILPGDKSPLSSQREKQRLENPPVRSFTRKSARALSMPRKRNNDIFSTTRKIPAPLRRSCPATRYLHSAVCSSLLDTNRFTSARVIKLFLKRCRAARACLRADIPTRRYCRSIARARKDARVQLSLHPSLPLPRRILTLGIGTKVATRRFLAAMRHPVASGSAPSRVERIFAEMSPRAVSPAHG